MPISFDQLNNWKSHSSKMLLSRSAELKLIDERVSAYTKTRSLQALVHLAWSVVYWHRSKSDWLDSNRSSAMVDLVNLIKQESRLLWPDVGGYIFNALYTTNEATSLESRPGQWLKENVLNVSGASDDGAEEFYLNLDSGDPIYEGGDVPARATIFSGPPLYQLKPGANRAHAGGKITRPCINIKMHTDIGRDSAAAEIKRKLIPLTGNFMTTGMINGCTFVIDHTNPGRLFATHIKPVGQSAEELQDLVAACFDLRNVIVFGQRDYGASEQVAIIGTTFGSWNIFAQLSPRGGRGNRDRDFGVTRVIRLYPR